LNVNALSRSALVLYATANSAKSERPSTGRHNRATHCRRWRTEKWGKVNRPLRLFWASLRARRGVKRPRPPPSRSSPACGGGGSIPSRRASREAASSHLPTGSCMLLVESTPVPNSPRASRARGRDRHAVRRLGLRGPPRPRRGCPQTARPAAAHAFGIAGGLKTHPRPPQRLF
jgi:hypothetical protein